MPKTGFRVWLFAVTLATAVTLLGGAALRLYWPAGVADPVAQAIGFTVGFLMAWPWFRTQSDTTQLGFPGYAAFVTAIAAIVAFLRIQYLG